MAASRVAAAVAEAPARLLARWGEPRAAGEASGGAKLCSEGSRDLPRSSVCSEEVTLRAAGAGGGGSRVGVSGKREGAGRGEKGGGGGAPVYQVPRHAGQGWHAHSIGKRGGRKERVVPQHLHAQLQHAGRHAELCQEVSVVQHLGQVVLAAPHKGPEGRCSGRGRGPLHSRHQAHAIRVRGNQGPAPLRSALNHQHAIPAHARNVRQQRCIRAAQGRWVGGKGGEGGGQARARQRGGRRTFPVHQRRVAQRAADKELQLLQVHLAARNCQVNQLRPFTSCGAAGSGCSHGRSAAPATVVTPGLALTASSGTPAVTPVALARALRPAAV